MESGKALVQPKKTDPKKVVPKSPMAGSLASRKLKSFAGKGSPKRRPSPKPSNTNVPQMEEVTKTSTTIRRRRLPRQRSLRKVRRSPGSHLIPPHEDLILELSRGGSEGDSSSTGRDV